METNEPINREQVQKIRSELTSLKSQLLGLNQKKEAAFHKKEDYKKQLIASIKEFREIMNQLSASAPEKENLKKQRDNLNQKGKELIKEAKKTHAERNKLFKKQGLRINPQSVKEKIISLDTKIETEALKFEDEKKIMKHINALKKKLHEAAAVKTIIKESVGISKEINATRNKADTFHHQLSEKRQKDKERYTHIKQLSKKIKQLRKDQEAAFDEFIATKKEFLQKNEELQKKLKELGPIIREQRFTREQKILRKQEYEAQKIAALEKAVEEKFRTKKKLTTEDLLVFQSK